VDRRPRGRRRAIRLRGALDRSLWPRLGSRIRPPRSPRRTWWSRPRHAVVDSKPAPWPCSAWRAPRVATGSRSFASSKRHPRPPRQSIADRSSRSRGWPKNTLRSAVHQGNPRVAP